MVRVGGLQYRIDPRGSMGNRISEMRLQGKLLEAQKTYKVAGWAPVSAAAKEVGGEPIWDVIATHLRDIKIVKSIQINEPSIVGISKNPGYQKT